MSVKKRKKNRKKPAKKTSGNAMSFDIGSELQRALGHHQSGKLVKAERIYGKVVRADPGNADALHLLGVIANQTGRFKMAESLIQKAIQQDPDQPLYYYNLAKVFKSEGQLDTAISCYRKSLVLNPDDPATCLALGNALAAKDERDEAILCYQRAIQLAPNYTDAYNNMGAVYKDQGKLDKAISVYSKALQLNPDDHEIHNNLGIALKSQGRFHEALSCYEKALQLRPDYADVYNNIGIVFKDQGQLGDAIGCYQKALGLRPDMPETHNNLGVALKDQGRLDEAVSCYHRALELNPDYPSAGSNLLYGLHHSATIDPAALFNQHLLWAKRHAAPLGGEIPSARSGGKRGHHLRIGYVSPDFRTHSVAYFMESVLENHDRSAFEIFGYSDVDIKDATSIRLGRSVDCWRDIAGIPDATVAQWVQDDKIDILVDLAGHTARNRMLLFARKPAPVQVTYLGYPNTTGMDTVDYRLTDGWADPPGLTDHLYTEQLVRLPGGFLSYTPPQESPAVGELPAERSGCITFGSFNNRAKITREVLGRWSKILLAVPNSRIHIKSKSLSDPAVRDSLHGGFLENDVPPERIRFLDYSPSTHDHLGCYSSVDIGLDTFPYNGTTTTCEAMWMGVPVIAMAGQIHMSRVGVSLLSNVGLGDLIGCTADDYVRLAVELAADLARLKGIRRGLRPRMRRSPLMNGPDFARSLENAYREMWENRENRMMG